MIWLIGVWVFAVAILLSLPNRYKLPAKWEGGGAILWVSVWVFNAQPFWRSLSFWFALAGGIVAQLSVFRALQPEDTHYRHGAHALA
jgi:hypothetical protein